jgi:hypothetical protein
MKYYLLLCALLALGSLGCSKEAPVDKNSDLANAGAITGDTGTPSKAPAKGMSPDSLTVPDSGK